MPLYRFCGSRTEVGEFLLDKFGQTVEFPEALAKDIIPILPAADFEGLNFTREELAKYSNPASHGRATPEFLAKKKAAITLCQERHARLEVGGSDWPEGGIVQSQTPTLVGEYTCEITADPAPPDPQPE